jgi:hypothetical protein
MVRHSGLSVKWEWGEIGSLLIEYLTCKTVNYKFVNIGVLWLFGANKSKKRVQISKTHLYVIFIFHRSVINEKISLKTFWSKKIKFSLIVLRVNL